MGAPIVTIEVDGTFDLSSARGVQELVLALRGATDIWLDFSRASRIQDRALGSIAAALVSAASPVHTRGLTHHQNRLLRYLGIDAQMPLSCPQTLHTPGGNHT